MNTKCKYIRWFEETGREDVGIVGGKNASLGEMVRELSAEGIRVPAGFATTADAYWKFLDETGLRESLQELLGHARAELRSLSDVGWEIRQQFLTRPIPEEIVAEIVGSYRRLCQLEGRDEVEVAVRSSATAEDLPDASFAGQQETFLNIRGEAQLLHACQRCYASLFTDRAISYRDQKGFDHSKVALSIGVQTMIRSDVAGSGVMFSIDTETGFPDVVIINAAWGLGENIVQGAVDPDEFVVFKPLLSQPDRRPIISKTVGSKEKKMIYARGGGQTTKNILTTESERRQFVLDDDEILKLARWAVTIEAHYGCPMDIEWAKDGINGELYIVQARPETISSTRAGGVLKTYQLGEHSDPILSGIAIGEGVASGQVARVESKDHMDQFQTGAVLVAAMTDPDWVPLMKRAAGIITDQGGRTCHAAIVSRELGIPAVIGTGSATSVLETGMEVTLSCAEGNRGYVYSGLIEVEKSDVDVTDVPATKTKIMMNLGTPQTAFQWWRLPADGIGLARMEFIIGNDIKIHPLALVHPDEVTDAADRMEIDRLTANYPDKSEFFVERLASGIARIAASQYPNPVIVRMSDFKSNEYADLIGGAAFEPKESNPMLGFRGASRYYSPAYRDGFALECEAIKRVRGTIGLDNVVVMIPFCRTLDEADRVLAVMSECGLERGKDGLQVYVMAEIPSNIILATQFAERFDGFSIGSNDLTQLVLGADRDSELLSEIFDERNDAVKRMIEMLIEAAHASNTSVGICGQAPSDHAGFAEFLVAAGIDSISVSPDKVVDVKRRVAAVE